VNQTKDNQTTLRTQKIKLLKQIIF